MYKKLKAYKDYASKYGISTIKTVNKKGQDEIVYKTVNELLNDIYDYERKNKVKDGLYPFLYIK